VVFDVLKATLVPVFFIILGIGNILAISEICI
jgi:hypothetical protein